MSRPLGLVSVPTASLENLLRAVHRKVVSCPLSPGELAMIRLQDFSAELLNQLRGLDEPAVRAVLVAVLAERIAQQEET